MGFVDTSVILREMTVKSIVPLAPKLRPQTVGLVMRAFAKLQLDEEAAIRTNTTICLGKIAAHIDPPTREKVLIPACCRALKDPFPPGRAAGLMSLTATQQYHNPMEIAHKVMPNVAPVVLDPERDVREAALTCLRVYMQRLEYASAQLSLPPEQREAANAAEDSSLDISNAADKAMGAMSWLTSTVAKTVTEVAGGHPGAQLAGGQPGGGGAPKLAGVTVGGYGTSGDASGVPLTPTAPYAPPKPAPPSSLSGAAVTAAASSIEGLGDDDVGLNDAFTMGRDVNAPPVTAQLSDDFFGLASSGCGALGSPQNGKGSQIGEPPAVASKAGTDAAVGSIAKPPSSATGTSATGGSTGGCLRDGTGGGTGAGGCRGVAGSVAAVTTARAASMGSAGLGRGTSGNVLPKTGRMPMGGAGASGSGLLAAPMIPIDAQPAMRPMGAQPAIRGAQPATRPPMGAQPAMMPMGAQPAMLPMGAQLDMLPMGAQPAMLPMGSQPAMLPMGSQPAIGSIGAGYGNLDPLVMLNQPAAKGLKKVAASRVQDDSWDKW